MDSERELLKGNTPTLVLAVLNDGPLHGYGIAREIERRSDNALRFKEGTLYPALHVLEKKGLIRSEWSTGKNGRERKYCSLTAKGRKAAEESQRQWSLFTTAVNAVISNPS